MNVRIVYQYNPLHDEFLHHWQMLEQHEGRNWYGRKEVVDDWVTVCCYDDFQLAQQAMINYLAGARH